MKYSIGDRVIVKESGEKGIVVNEFYGNCVYVFHSDQRDLLHETELLTDLTAIEKQFGLLSKEVQEELKAVNNGKNIQFYSGHLWHTITPKWDNHETYRLSPTYKQEEVKEMTVGEIEAKLGHKVKVVKGE